MILTLSLILFQIVVHTFVNSFIYNTFQKRTSHFYPKRVPGVPRPISPTVAERGIDRARRSVADQNRPTSINRKNNYYIMSMVHIGFD